MKLILSIIAFIALGVIFLLLFTFWMMASFLKKRESHKNRGIPVELCWLSMCNQKYAKVMLDNLCGCGDLRVVFKMKMALTFLSFVLWLAFWGALAFLLAFVFSNCKASAQLPPMPPTNHIVITNRPPRPLTVMTNITVSWNCYTDAWFEIDATTDFVSWYPKTNVPIWKTNIVIPITPGQPWEFYRAQTKMNALTP